MARYQSYCLLSLTTVLITVVALLIISTNGYAQQEPLTEESPYGLSFELNDPKMRAFATAAAEIDQINKKWDIEIAGAANDQVAIENNAFARNEIMKVFAKMQETLSMDEYNEIFEAANLNRDLNMLTQSYMRVYREGMLDDIPVYSAAPENPEPEAVPQATPPVAPPVQ